MKEIPLTQGKVAIVDDEDYPDLIKHNWHVSLSSSGQPYAVRTVKKANGKQTSQMLSRFLMGVTEKNQEVDHKNHDTLDNRRINLRICSRRQNQQNRLGKMNSKYPGVTWHRGKNRWQARISVSGKRVHLGHFVDELDAAKAYERGVRSLGEELICKMKKVSADVS